VAVLTWDDRTHKLSIRVRTPEKDAPYLQMDNFDPFGQLEEGWYPPEGDYCWTAPRAVAQLRRPEGARRLELRVLVGPAQIKALEP